MRGRRAAELPPIARRPSGHVGRSGAAPSYRPWARAAFVASLVALAIALLGIWPAPSLANPRTAAAVGSDHWVNLNLSGPRNESEYAFAWGTPSASPAYGLLFGGRHNGTHSGILNQTWEFENGNWTELFPKSSPPPSRYPVMAWDPPIDAFVLFGGSYRTYSNTTWTFSNGTWSKVAVAHPPPARRSAGLAFDPALNEVLLWGGHDSFPGTGATNQSTYYMLNDTWALSVVKHQFTWTNLTARAGTAPPPVSEPSLAWDPAVNAVIEFGGYDQGIPQLEDGRYVAYNSTWAFTAGRWVNLSLSVAPYARDGAAFAYDPALQAMVLFGGQNEANRNGHNLDNDTWTLNGTRLSSLRWTEINTSSAPPRMDSLSMVWDTQIDEEIIFGGVGHPPVPKRGDLLFWYGATWALVTP